MQLLSGCYVLCNLSHTGQRERCLQHVSSAAPHLRSSGLDWDCPLTFTDGGSAPLGCLAEEVLDQLSPEEVNRLQHDFACRMQHITSGTTGQVGWKQ